MSGIFLSKHPLNKPCLSPLVTLSLALDCTMRLGGAGPLGVDGPTAGQAQGRGSDTVWEGASACPSSSPCVQNM